MDLIKKKLTECLLYMWYSLQLLLLRAVAATVWRLKVSTANWYNELVNSQNNIRARRKDLGKKEEKASDEIYKVEEGDVDEGLIIEEVRLPLETEGYDDDRER